MSAPQAHAVLSASGSGRWMACPPSAQLERQFPDETSEYAAEGTFAHSLAELHLAHYLGYTGMIVFNQNLKKLKGNPHYSQDMEDYIQDYRDLVIERINEARTRTKDLIVLLEQRLDYSPWVPDGFGTGDVVIIADKTLDIIDLKYGKGVPVSAENNSQMRLYGLGALHQFEHLYDIETVRMTITQPRLDSVSTAEMTAEELLAWAEKVVKPLAKMAIAGEGTFSAGDHCRFCKARYTCRERANANLKMAQYDFREPPLLSHDEIAAVLSKAEELQKWTSDVQNYALEQAEKHGVKFPGWKLVEGRSNRKYTDKDAVATILLAEGYKEGDIYKPKEILGITDMEKTLGKKRFNQLLHDHVIKPAGKPTLAPETDKRTEINSIDSAKADFNEAV
ncbi:DUF2800 domain-containing protein [Desulforamulus ruminis]|uniref:DUF2800 domain-containing protein n=1 Tax=Desulforamulus ruminis (strain ATCC 23193 / DSM 2154 / NCIMB 8452 / DL) TaxID=696281 RepID=F6DM08_DESRL|nr:DUF2800 domain-containing protein [Desulforamulus ruminis]AEG59350.1 hypothetical protein Desru_1075 [Desulforamulus ruminis DSM 2154]